MSTNDVKNVTNDLSHNKWLEEEEEVGSVEKPREGNMNFVLRVKTSKHDVKKLPLILTQQNKFVLCGINNDETQVFKVRE